MSISDKPEELKLPKRPGGAWNRALYDGAIGGVVGAGIEVVWQALKNYAHERKQSFNTNKIVDWAGTMAITLGIVGYIQAKHDQKDYELKTRDVKLQHRVNELEAKLSQTTSHVEKLSDKEQPPQEQLAR